MGWDEKCVGKWNRKGPGEDRDNSGFKGDKWVCVGARRGRKWVCVCVRACKQACVRASVSVCVCERGNMCVCVSVTT